MEGKITKEDKYLDKIAEERATKNAKFISHKKAWLENKPKSAINK